jgi:eukaryotic-like serine/threonine-protein kinase
MSLPLAAGDLVAGKYRIVRVIGQGAMGVVLGADDLQLPRQVAIKVMLPTAQPAAAERFAREARVSVQIDSEHIPRVFDVGALPSGDPYIVMELLHGCDLEQYRRTTRKLPIPEATDYVLQTCEALAAAHKLGLVHRDIKPANLFRVERPDGAPVIKVLDFGISKVNVMAGVAPRALTATAEVLGSPLYMSPEQLTDARKVDARADIWSLGVVLHDLLTGTTPFTSANLARLCGAILRDDPWPIRAVRHDAPQALEAVVLRCLAKQPADRYANVAEVALALAPYVPARARPLVDRVVDICAAAGWSPPLAHRPTAAMALPEAELGAAPGAASVEPMGSAPTVLAPTVLATVVPAAASRAPAAAGRRGLVLGAIALGALAVVGLVVVGVVLSQGGEPSGTSRPRATPSSTRSTATAAPSWPATTSSLARPSSSRPEAPPNGPPLSLVFNDAPAVMAKLRQARGGAAPRAILLAFRERDAELRVQSVEDATRFVRYRFQDGQLSLPEELSPPEGQPDAQRVQRESFPTDTIEWDKIPVMVRDMLEHVARTGEKITELALARPPDGAPQWSVKTTGASKGLYDQHGQRLAPR